MRPGTVAAVYELLSTNDVDGLVAFSSRTFARPGLEVAFPSLVRANAPGLESAIADGYTDALLMPPTAWQQEHAVAVVGAFASGDGWDAPYVEVGGLAPARRPATDYVLLLRPDPRSDDDLRGLTAPALRKALGEDACLTVNEYVIVQRLLAERFGDHRFDDYSADPSGWMWLADSTDGALTAMGYWNGAKRRIEVAACKTGSKNPRKGARRCRIVPLEPS